VNRQFIPILRLENLAAAIVFLGIYRHLSYDWLTFVYLFLVPDLAFLAYLLGPRAGAYVYNATHSYIGPAVLVLYAQLFTAPDQPASLHLQIALIWLIHCAIDRTLGFGLKSTESFHSTHLGHLKFGASRDGETPK
jgi:hypothetical protein